MKLEENCKNHKYVETEQHATEQLLGQWRNQKVPEDKWQWKYNIPKSMGYSKSGTKREVYSNTGLPQETKISSK